MIQYEVYNYDDIDTYTSLCQRYNIPFTELLRINNISQPLKSDFVKDTVGLQGTLLVPVQASDVPQQYVLRKPTKAPGRAAGISAVGWASQYKCYMTIYGASTIKVYFPCMPQSFSDSRTASYTSQNPLGRSEPFQIYENSGPRTVSVSFRMHKEMLHVTPIEDVVTAVQSATYPIAWNGTIPPKVTLVIGNSCVITGIIAGGVETTWSETIDKNWKYNSVDLSFTVTECTGNPKTMADVLRPTSSFGY